MRLQNTLSIIATLMLAIVASIPLHAQDGDEYDFDDIPVDDARQYYVAVGGGYLGMLAFPKFDELNRVSSDLGLPDFDGEFLMNGGGGLISLLVVPNLRLGVFGAGGSRINSATVAINDSMYKRSLRFSSVVTGGQLDYAIRLFRSFTILPGVMVGSGSYTLEMTQSRDGGENYEDVFVAGPTDVSNRYARITRSHLFYYPAINLEYAFTQFVMVRAGIGYSGTSFEGDWTDGTGTKVNNVPEVSAGGMTLQFGLFMGLFQTQ